MAGWIQAVTEYLEAERTRLESGQQRRPRDPRAVPALRRARRTRPTCRPASTAGTFTPPTARRWPSRRGARCRSSSATTARCGGVGEAQRVRGAGTGGVLMLAPGSGLGSAYVDARRAAAAGRHARRAWRPRTCRRRCTCSGAKPYPCGCGRTWGCVELYTTLAGLALPAGRAADVACPITRWRSRRPDAARKRRWRCAAWRRRATRWPSSCSTSRRARWACTSPTWSLALDPEFVVIGGGLMDPENTTDAFRERYLRHRARDGAAAPVAGAARAAHDPAVDAGRAVAGDRRGAGRALPQPALKWEPSEGSQTLPR